MEGRDGMVWPVAVLVVAQVVHVVVPVDADKPSNDSIVGLIGGILFLGLSVAALLGLLQGRRYGRPLGARVGLAVAVGFVAYHAVPWTTVLTNPYLGQPVGVPAWISVGLAVGAGSWAASEGRDVLVPTRTSSAGG